MVESRTDPISELARKIPRWSDSSSHSDTESEEDEEKTQVKWVSTISPFFLRK